MEPLREILQRYWGYSEFRPLQAEAMQAVMAGRDSVVVLSTGGGKSLCFQAPALLMPGLAVIVSPLIALMKDQVDALADNGVPAAFINSTSSTDDRLRIAREIREGRLKLLYLSPERLMTAQAQQFLKQTPLSFFAIDEAHCISDWGHDFRPEYRQLASLKSLFPGVAVHAYTATATERVREDIVRQLQLDNAEVLVGNFDRPNLVYRVQRRSDRLEQIEEVIARHANESGVIYCIRRKDVDDLCSKLREAGRLAVPYHAGMSDDDRKRSQEAFLGDRAQIIVATVAFGMGIDKPDVRYVVHAGVPKSLEAYQQESGRAGRDALEAECCLFWSPGDFITWRKFQSELPPDAADAAETLLQGIDRFCSSSRCRHQSLVNYFGQEYAGENCGACDICLSEVEFVADPLIVGQKILSCVLRVNQNFGGGYVTQVLVGSREQRILDQGHDRLSTYGLMKEHPKDHLRAWIDQLVEQGFLTNLGEYPVLKVTPTGRQLLKGELTPRLIKPAEAKEKKPEKTSRAAVVSWEGVDRELFEELRIWRRDKASERNVPTFVIFSDATLRDLARRRPASPERLLAAQGIGEKKLSEYGRELLALIAAYCGRTGVTQDVAIVADTLVRPKEKRGEALPSSGKQLAFDLFAAGCSVDEVCERAGRARSTVSDYLGEFIEREGITDSSHWLDAATFDRIAQAAAVAGLEKMKPVFEALGGTVPYDQIRIAFGCLRNAMQAAT